MSTLITLRCVSSRGVPDKLWQLVVFHLVLVFFHYIHLILFKHNNKTGRLAVSTFPIWYLTLYVSYKCRKGKIIDKKIIFQLALALVFFKEIFEFVNLQLFDVKFDVAFSSYLIDHSCLLLDRDYILQCISWKTRINLYIVVGGFNPEVVPSL